MSEWQIIALSAAFGFVGVFGILFIVDMGRWLFLSLRHGMQPLETPSVDRTLLMYQTVILISAVWLVSITQTVLMFAVPMALLYGIYRGVRWLLF